MIFQLILAAFFSWLCIGTKELHDFGKKKFKKESINQAIKNCKNFLTKTTRIFNKFII